MGALRVEACEDEPKKLQNRLNEIETQGGELFKLTYRPARIRMGITPTEVDASWIIIWRAAG